MRLQKHDLLYIVGTLQVPQGMESGSIWITLVTEEKGRSDRQPAARGRAAASADPGGLQATRIRIFRKANAYRYDRPNRTGALDPSVSILRVVFRLINICRIFPERHAHGFEALLCAPSLPCLWMHSRAASANC
jgi:hypothetical protein